MINNEENLCNPIFLTHIIILNAWLDYILSLMLTCKDFHIFKSFWVLLLGLFQVKLLMYPPFPLRMFNKLHIFHILNVKFFDLPSEILSFSLLPPPSHTAGPQVPRKRFLHEIIGRVWNRNIMINWAGLKCNIRL